MFWLFDGNVTCKDQSVSFPCFLLDSRSGSKYLEYIHMQKMTNNKQLYISISIYFQT